MTYRVTYSSQARSALAEVLPEAVASACIEFIGADVSANPFRVGKPLRAPLEGLHSARRGDFRIIYRIDQQHVTVLIITIEHRRDVYRT